MSTAIRDDDNIKHTFDLAKREKRAFFLGWSVYMTYMNAVAFRLIRILLESKTMLLNTFLFIFGIYLYGFEPNQSDSVERNQ